MAGRVYCYQFDDRGSPFTNSGPDKSTHKTKVACEWPPGHPGNESTAVTLYLNDGAIVSEPSEVSTNSFVSKPSSAKYPTRDPNGELYTPVRDT